MTKQRFQCNHCCGPNLFLRPQLWTWFRDPFRDDDLWEMITYRRNHRATNRAPLVEVFSSGRYTVPRYVQWSRERHRPTDIDHRRLLSNEWWIESKFEIDEDYREYRIMKWPMRKKKEKRWAKCPRERSVSISTDGWTWLGDEISSVWLCLFSSSLWVNTTRSRVDMLCKNSSNGV